MEPAPVRTLLSDFPAGDHSHRPFVGANNNHLWAGGKSPRLDGGLRSRRLSGTELEPRAAGEMSHPRPPHPSQEHRCPPSHLTQTTTATPEQFIAATHRLRAGPLGAVPAAAPTSYLAKVHDRRCHRMPPTSPRARAASGSGCTTTGRIRTSVVEDDRRLQHVGRRRPASTPSRRGPDGTTGLDVVVVREGKNLKGQLIGVWSVPSASGSDQRAGDDGQARSVGITGAHGVTLLGGHPARPPARRVVARVHDGRMGGPVPRLSPVLGHDGPGRTNLALLLLLPVAFGSGWVAFGTGSSGRPGSSSPALRSPVSRYSSGPVSGSSWGADCGTAREPGTQATRHRAGRTRPAVRNCVASGLVHSWLGAATTPA